jgi:DNA-binding NarL/FixJ family response regulator
VNFVARIDVVIANDQPLSLIGIRSAVSDQRDIRILRECQDPKCLVEAIRRTTPDVLLVSGELLHDECGALKQLVSQVKKTHVILVTSRKDQGFLDGALRCGAKGVIQTECPIEEIPAAIRRVTSGGVWLERAA